MIDENIQPEPTPNESATEQDNVDSIVQSEVPTEATVAGEIPSGEEVHELHQYHDRLVQNTFITEIWPVLMSRPEIALVLYRKLQMHYAVPHFS
jgi:hypothetical protein